jgi:hypothetical protein
MGLILSPYLILAVHGVYTWLRPDPFCGSFRMPLRGRELGGAGTGPAFPWE